MQNGCRFNQLWRLLAVAGAVGAVSGAALANDTGRTPDQKAVKAAPVQNGTSAAQPAQAPGKALPSKAVTPVKPAPVVGRFPALRGPGPANDTCANAEAVAVGGSAFGTTVGAFPDAEALACSGPGDLSGGVWYSVVGNGNTLRAQLCNSTSGIDTVMRVLTGPCEALSCIELDDDDCCFVCPSAVNFPTANGQTYYIYVSTYSADPSAANEFLLEIVDLGGPPVNDECAGAIMLECNSTIIADNTLATINPADPFLSCHFGGPQQGDGSLWYNFVATDTSVRIQTCGSFFPADDSLIAVFDSCGGFEIGCSEDFCGLLSRVDLEGLVIGNVYTIMLASYDVSDQGAYNLSLTCPIPAALPGDNCETAFALAVPGSASGDTSGYEPDGAAAPGCGVVGNSPTVWYSVVGDGNMFHASLCNGTGYDAGLAIYSGVCGGLICHDADDDGCGIFAGPADAFFPTVAGETYYIVVGGFGTNFGAYTLEVNSLPPPPNDECDGAEAIACGQLVVIDNTAATTNPFDPPFSCHVLGPTTQGFGTMWYSFTAGDTSARFSACGNVSPADDSVLAIYDACGGFELACNDDFCGFLSRMDVTGLTVGQTYTLQFASWSPSDQAVYTMEVICPVPPIPPGDECPTALPIDALPFTVSGDTSTFNPDGPLPACGAGAAANSVWYSLAGNGHIIEASLCNGTGYDSAIAVYTGFDCGSLSCVSSDDDGCGIFAGPSRTSFFSQVGQTYYIVVRGYGSSFGFYNLEVNDLGEPQPGDDCATALPLELPAFVSGDTSVGFTPDAGVPFCGALGSSPTIWYSVVGNGNVYRASLCAGTAYDSALAAFTGPDCFSLVCAGANDDFCGLQSQMDIFTNPGETYYIVVGGFGTNAGAYTLEVTDIGPPCEAELVGPGDEENEFDCGLPVDTVNGGCNSSPFIAGNISCGVPLAGSSAYDGSIGFRDTDWYFFDLPQDDFVTVTVRAEFNTLFGIIGDANNGPVAWNGDPFSFCPATGFVNPAGFGLADCSELSVVSNLLPAGTYIIFVSNTFDANAFCGGRDDYVVTVSTGMGCPGGDDCNQNGIPDSTEIAGNPALDCYNPAVIANPNVMGGPDGALDSCQCMGDFNRNNVVNSSDISALLTGWLAAVNANNTNADIDCSGSTNSSDISAFLTLWLNQVTNSDPNDGCP